MHCDFLPALASGWLQVRAILEPMGDPGGLSRVVTSWQPTRLSSAGLQMTSRRHPEVTFRKPLLQAILSEEVGHRLGTTQETLPGPCKKKQHITTHLGGGARWLAVPKDLELLDYTISFPSLTSLSSPGKPQTTANLCQIGGFSIRGSFVMQHLWGKPRLVTLKFSSRRCGFSDLGMTATFLWM